MLWMSGGGSTSPPECSAAPVRTRDRARSRRPARPGRAAATVLVAGLLLLGAAAAEAQTAPTVTGVALTSDPGADETYAYYGITLVQADVVEVTVTFSGAVDITGTPQLELDFDGTAKAAACATGTNTTTMVCSYTVAENDSAPNGIAIAANKLTGGTIYATGSTTVNAVLTHSAVAIDSGHKVDGSRPTLVTTGTDAPKTSTDGTQVILTFNEDLGSVEIGNLNMNTTPVVIPITAGSTATISGRTVTVTLDSVFTIEYGQTIEMGLGVGFVQDSAGNRSVAVSLGQAVTNNVPQPPAAIDMVEITSDPGMDNNYATGEDIEVTATFDQAVNVSGTPQILLRLGGGSRGARWAEYSSGTGTTALVFSYPVKATDESDTDGIEVGDPSNPTEDVDLNGGTITVVSTGENASLSYSPLHSDSGHRVNWARPTLSAAVTSTDGTRVILTFSEDLRGESVGHSLFTVKVDGTAVTLSGTTAPVSDNLVTLTLATALTSATQAVTVSYVDDSTGIEDLVGNDADSFTDQTVTNRFAPPAVSSVAFTSAPGSDNTYAIGDSVAATVTFDAAVDITGTPQLELDFDGTAKAAGCATGTNTTTMVCEYEVVVSDSAPNGVAIAANKLTGGTIYATGSTTVNADLDHSAVSIDAGHKVDGIRPTLVTTAPDAPTTSTDGTKVILTFSEDISAVDRTKITIQANSVTAATSAASATGTKVELTLTTALTTTDTNLTVELSADAVVDAASNGILAVAATTVTNAVGTTTAPTVSGVALTSAPGSDNTYAIGDSVAATVTFDAAVDITGTPQLELDFDGTAKAAGCATGTNTTTMVCEYEVVVSDSAPNGVAIAANKLTGGTIYATGSTTVNADLDHSAVSIDAGHKVDGIRPTLVTTAPDAPTTSTDGTKVILTFSEDISAVDRTKITIQANSVTAATSAASATGTKVELTLTTALTTTDTNLTVELSADAVVDAASNGILAVAATTVTNAVGTTTAPTVSGVALTSAPGSDNTYAISDAVEATVTFSAAVDITGTPQLELDFDGTAKAAGCTAATNTTTMACSYTVLVGDSAPNGVEIEANKLTGGTIYATGGTTTSADLDHTAVAIDAGHKVDGIRPTLVTTAPDAPTTSADGETVLLVFSEDIGAVSHSDITIQANGATVSTTMASVAGTKVELTLTTALTASATTITVALAADAVDDAAGNGILAVAATTVTNAVGTTTAPTVSGVALTSAPGSDNTYAISDAVEATVTFSAAVDITGTPQLELDFDGTAKAAGCTAATNTTTMACSYTVLVGDSAPNGVEIEANKLTGGTIYATGGTTTSADLDHTAVAIDAGHKVDGIRPTLVTTAPDAPTTSADGETVLLVFSEDIGAVSHSDITIQANGATVSTTMASVAGTKVELTLTTALTASATTITVALAADAVDDAAGNGILAVAATPVTNAVGTTTAARPGRPAAPSVSSVPGSTTSLEVTWTAPANTGPAIESYDLRYREGTSGSWTNGPQNVSGTSETISGLTASTSYQVQVLATNSEGNSLWSPSGSGQTNTAGNNAPAFSSATATRSVPENSPPSTNVGAPVTATDADNDPLTYTLEGTDADSFEIVSTSGQIRTRSGVTYDQSTYAVIVKADDSNGGSDTIAVTITVTTGGDGGSSNNAPAFSSATATRSVPENSPAGTNVGAPVTATDADNDPLTYTLEGADPDSFEIVSTSGQIRTRSGVTYDQSTYAVIVKADDGHGGSDTIAVTITVTTGGEPPLAVDDAAETPEDTPVTIDVLGNDRDPDGDTLTVVEVSAPAHGTARLTNAGTVEYTPEPDFHGIDRFTYVVDDGTGETARATVEVTVQPVNDPPQALDDVAETPEDTPVTIAVRANDSDPDGDVLALVQASAPAHGTARLTDAGAVEYTPEPDYHGADRFTYTVGDGSGLTAQAAVEVTVQPVNDPPQALDDAAETPEDTPVTIDVLGNDSDRDGDTLTVVEMAAPGHGTARLTDAGAVEYTPEPDYHGADRFTYAVGDGSGLTAQAAVEVTVLPVNDPPQALGVIPDQTLEAGNGPASLDLSPFFEDRDGDELGYAAVASEPAVALSLAGATLTLTVARPGAATVTVTAQDPGGLTATQAFMVTTTDRQARGVVEDTLAALGRGHLASARATLGRRVETTGQEASQVTVAGLHVPLGTGAAAAGRAVAERWITGLAGGMPLQSGGRSGSGLGAVPGAVGVAGAPGAMGSPAGALGLAAGGTRFGSAGAVQFGGGASPTRSSLSPLGGGAGTEFLLALGSGQAGDGAAQGHRWTVWGQIDQQAFGGERSPAARYDGHLQTAYVGVDARLSERWLAGLAVARSRGDGDWTFGASTGRLTTTLTSVQPYLRWSDGGTTIWATAGGGTGSAEHERMRYGLQEDSALGLRLGLVEVRRRLATVGGGVELQLRGDASWARLTTAAGDELIDALEVDVHQLRVGIDVSRPVRTAGGTLVEPFGEVHARRDGGAGQTGAGLELAGGLRVARGVFRVEGMGRLLALHAADGYREHGGAVTLSVGDGARQPGLTLSLSPRWGAPATASDALWQDQLFHQRAAGTPGARRDERALDARVDYGLQLPGGGLVTPFGIYGQSPYGRRLQVGLLLNRLGPVGLEVSGERSALRQPGRDDYRMSVLGRLTFGGADNASASLEAVP